MNSVYVYTELLILKSKKQDKLCVAKTYEVNKKKKKKFLTIFAHHVHMFKY